MRVYGFRGLGVSGNKVYGLKLDAAPTQQQLSDIHSVDI